MSNKCDLEEQTAVSEVEGQALAARIGAAFVEVNAKAGHNIVEVHVYIWLTIVFWVIEDLSTLTASIV